MRRARACAPLSSSSDASIAAKGSALDEMAKPRSGWKAAAKTSHDVIMPRERATARWRTYLPNKEVDLAGDARGEARVT